MDLSLVALAILVLALVIGVPVPFAFGISLIFIVWTGGYDAGSLIPSGAGKIDSIVLLAIPLFILVGGLMDRGRTADPLVDLAATVGGRLRGALGSTAVVATGIVGSISGSAAATLSCVGGIMFPRLGRAGYPEGYYAALLACSAPLGLLIPPSAIQILYGWISGESILACFLATTVPGILAIIGICLANHFMMRNVSALDDAGLAPGGGRWRRVASQGRRGVPALLTPVVVLGGIYAGIMTPTEAAGVGAFYTLILGFLVYRGLTFGSLREVLVDTATTTGVIMIMLFVAMILSRIFILEGVPSQILGGLQTISTNPLILMLVINLFMVIIGMIMDDVSAVLLCTPILLPVVKQLGIDPVHFAAILGVNLGVGNITPPTAPILYLSSRISGVNIAKMMSPTMFILLVVWLPLLLITTYIPQVALWLPHALIGY